MKSVFAAIDLKSFYASVECHERGLSPLKTHLVVADESRTNKTICLAVSPSLKAYGIPGRARLFEVERRVQEINAERKRHTTLGVFVGKSSDADELAHNPNLEMSFIIATPRMRYYLDYSSKIYQIYLRHVASQDLFSYSIDEVFCDLTSYLKLHNVDAEAMVTQMLADVEQQTGITATAGIGTNLFLAKVAMDILAKHVEPNAAGVRIAKLDEQQFKRELWTHRPITDFWRVGPGYAKRLAKLGLFTMGDVARCSLANEDILYKAFGVNAELLIDHSWGYEPVSLAEVKSYRPATRSLSSGQVLMRPYNYAEAQTIVKEMAESLALKLVEHELTTRSLHLGIVYDHDNKTEMAKIDRYGRVMPKPVDASITLDAPTASSQILMKEFLRLYRMKVEPKWTIRKVYVEAHHLQSTRYSAQPVQTELFVDHVALEKEQGRLEREQRLQRAMLKIRERYGKNAILRGLNFESEATGRTRHHQIGGHKA